MSDIYGKVPGWIKDSRVARLDKFGPIFGRLAFCLAVLAILAALFSIVGADRFSSEPKVGTSVYFFWGVLLSAIACGTLSLVSDELKISRIKKLALERAKKIMSAGGPKTLEEALFFTPDACKNCGHNQFSVVENRGYSQLSDYGRQGESCSGSWGWVCVTVYSKYCMRCNLPKSLDWIKDSHHEDDEILIELRRLQHDGLYANSDEKFLWEYGAAGRVDLKREFSWRIERVSSPYISKEQQDLLQDPSLPLSNQKTAESK